VDKAPHFTHCIRGAPDLLPSLDWLSTHETPPQRQFTTVIDSPGTGVGAEHWQAGGVMVGWARRGLAAKAISAMTSAAPQIVVDRARFFELMISPKPGALAPQRDGKPLYAAGQVIHPRPETQ
jgi:hypothetical protein